jgi:hypothetical protein
VYLCEQLYIRGREKLGLPNFLENITRGRRIQEIVLWNQILKAGYSLMSC